MFGKIFGRKAAETISKFSGRTDFLEAVCAGCALVAYADGEASDDEVLAMVAAVKANKALSEGFTAQQIDKTINTMLERAGAGRTGRAALRKEVLEVAKDPEMAEVVILSALDVADANGQIKPEEQKVLEALSKDLGVNLDKLAAI